MAERPARCARNGVVMTKDEILDIPAGREMDALIAKECDLYSNSTMLRFGDLYIPEVQKYCRPFSTDMSAAWKVVEKMIDGENPNNCDLRTSVHGWRCDFHKGQANAETAPLAICRAALMAKLES